MTGAKKVLLLVGSAKPVGASSSEALGRYLLSGLADRGWRTEIRHVARSLRTESRTVDLLEAVDSSDLWVAASPLYVDSLPHLMTEALERIFDHRRKLPSPPEMGFAAISNCGFPEPEHNEPALEIYRLFAQEAGFRWLGGLAQGGGQPLGGQPLDESGGMARFARAALDLAAEALSNGEGIPPRAAELMARPLIGPRLYVWMGEMGWRWQAWRNGVYRELRARPYAKPRRSIDDRSSR